MISQFFILSDRGDRLILKDFRFDTPITSCEKFLRVVRSWPKGDCPPVFVSGAITYIFEKKNGLYFVINTKMNMSPALGVEILNRILKIIKDYCGMLTEEAVRKNFALIYELLDEAIDFGYPQDTSSEVLANYVHNKPVVVADPKKGVIGDVNKSVIADRDKKKKVNELYVDVFERLNCMMNLHGEVISQSIDGSISMRSYLSGCPPVRMLLAENTVIGKDSPLPDVKDTTGRPLTAEDFIVLDDINFNGCMKLDKFDAQRLLCFNPPEGEFTAVNYRITTSFKPPFTLRPMVEEKSETKIELILQVRAEFEPDVEANNVFISMHAPHDTTTCTVTLAPDVQGQVKEYREKERRVLWMISKVTGQKEYYLKVVFNLEKPANQFITKEISPVALNFEIPNYQVSGLRIRGLAVDVEDKNYNAHRYIRYITQSNSYCCRL
ncbi:hypothetical protein WA577_002776 [Blastocystis sp. JDR]